MHDHETEQSKMRNKEAILLEMDKGTEQERNAAEIIRKLNFIDIKDRTVGGIGVEEGKLSIFLNEKEFEELPYIVKKTIFVEFGELVLGKYHIRGVGKELLLWNLAVSLEMSCIYHHTIPGALIPELFGMERNLFAEEYYMLFQEKRNDLEMMGDHSLDDFLQRTDLINYNEELGHAIDNLLEA